MIRKHLTNEIEMYHCPLKFVSLENMNASQRAKLYYSYFHCPIVSTGRHALIKA